MSLVYDTRNELVFMGFISDKPTNITFFQVRMVCLKVNKPKLNPLEIH